MSSIPLKEHSIARRSHEGHMIEHTERLKTSELPPLSHREHEKKMKSRSPHQYLPGNNPLSSLSTITMDSNHEDTTSDARNGGACGDNKTEGEEGEEFSTVSEKAGNIFELFEASDGEEYTVYVRDDGKRFYVDFEEQVSSSCRRYIQS